MAERKRCKGCRKYKGFFKEFSEAGYCPDCEKTRPWTIEEYIVKRDRTLDCKPEDIVFLGFTSGMALLSEPIDGTLFYTLKGFNAHRSLLITDWLMADMLEKVYPYVAK